MGQHDNDGSGLTFEMMHGVPTANSMYGSDSNAGGWSSSAMWSWLDESNSNNYLWKSMLSAELKTDIVSVSKKCLNGGTSKVTTGKDIKLWVISFSEITSTTMDGYKDEGSQYQYYAQILKDTYVSSKNPGLKCIGSRAGEGFINVSAAGYDKVIGYAHLIVLAPLTG